MEEWPFVLIQWVAWDKLVMQSFLVVYREYPTRDLIFLCIHTRLKVRVYTKENQLTRGIFHGIPLESIA